MRNKRLFLMLIGLILFVAIMGFSLSDRKNLSWPEKFINDSVALLQSWLYKPAGYMAGLFEDIRTMRHLYEENEQLRTTVARYARDRSTYNYLKEDNDYYKSVLQFTEAQKNQNNYEYLIAQVIAANPDAYNKTFKINRGSKNGIQKDMAVITIDGLVGLVSEVSPITSTVMPITELNAQSSFGSKKISATVSGKDSFGIVESYNSETGQLMMSKIAEDDPLQEGDMVITSGLGSVFPRGIEIGKVKSKQVGDFGLTYTAYIEPSAKLDKLREVLVVKVPDPEAEGQKE
ncbi:rod shape-determining protein MreC [Paenibacillus sp. GCM10012307]|uniref:Cell shape-determining protein MreC n=1 Tax=Paenibacillus roseus TaxID=2798579 RepID=A0A934J166_9BACL|nr:rod shape-determining protein MreC [Paenibacillus roseus]MBJ6362926.1 rod shape-determining protein MreC [Paenibacillus roseus]